MVKTKQKKDKLIGKISHYYGNIGVAVIDLTGVLKIGDSIRIVGGEDTDFTQEVESMEADHKKIKTAKSGSSVGLKIKEKAREDYKVYKI
jgi:translation elongation factor EF-1alpha